jgi:tetratricopeptide (TPR) repeat protein
MKPGLGARYALLLSICIFSACGLFAKDISCTIQKPPTDAPFQAYTGHEYSKAFDLYSDQAKGNPDDVDAIAGQVRSLLKEQDVANAADLAESSVAKHPNSAVLQTVLGEVRFRQGRLTEAYAAYQTSLMLDPCLPRTRYEMYKMLWIESMRSSAYEQLLTAHQLEPDDPDIHLEWMETLPLVARSKAIDNYLSDPKDKQEDSLKDYADRLHAVLAARHGSCRLISPSATGTTLPFQYLMNGPTRITGLGFDVTVNKKAKARLELDTGASGIFLNYATAKKVGLTPVSNDNISGIGDDKSRNGYWAYADDLRVGSLEFRNCLVQVTDKKSAIDIDGLIGTDVFENYHVQLDFPMHQMSLSALPLRPGEAVVDKASLNASGIGAAAAASQPHPESATKSTTAPPTIHYFDRYVAPDMNGWSPFARFGHQILINAQLKDGKPRLFILDSGSNHSILAVSAAKSVSKIHIDDHARVVGLNGKIKQIYTADHVDVVFAGLRDPLHDVLVMDMDKLSKDDGTEVSGLIGMDTLIMLTVDIDYRDGLIHLTFNPRHGTNAYREGVF